MRLSSSLELRLAAICVDTNYTEERRGEMKKASRGGEGGMTERGRRDCDGGVTMLRV